MAKGQKKARESANGKKQYHAISESTSMTRVTDPEQTVRAGCSRAEQCDARTIRDMTRGLARRLTDFERSVRRLDGSQDAATDFASVRAILAEGVDESIAAIDEAREASIPCAGLVEIVERCRASLDNAREQPGGQIPLPVDESIVGADDDAIRDTEVNEGTPSRVGPRRVVRVPSHPSQIPLPSSSRSSSADVNETRREYHRLVREARDMGRRLEELERRSHHETDSESFVSTRTSVGSRPENLANQTTPNADGSNLPHPPPPPPPPPPISDLFIRIYSLTPSSSAGGG